MHIENINCLKKFKKKLNVYTLFVKLIIVLAFTIVYFSKNVQNQFIACMQDKKAFFLNTLSWHAVEFKMKV